MYIDSINSQDTDYVISSFQETLINTQDNDEVKTIDFPSGYNLDSNLSFNIMFKYGHICSANDKPMTLNGKAIKVYSYSDPTILVNLPMITVSSKIWTLKPNTSLELYYDGTRFIVVGNPIVYTTNDCDYYANGKVEYKKSIVTTQNKVNQSCNVLLQGNQVGGSGYYNVNTACGNTLTFNSCTGVLTATTFSGDLDGTASCATNANNATKFNNCTYDCAKADIRSGRVTILDVTANEHSLALCTGTNTVGISNGCPLKFNSTTGVLTATKFCGSLCGTASNALSANDSTMFGGCTYQEARTDIRNGLMCHQDIDIDADYNVLLCVANDKAGASSNKSFIFNPSTGVVCACCFYASDICLNISSENRFGNIPYVCVGCFSNVTYIGLFYGTTSRYNAFFSKVYSSSYRNKQCDVFNAISCATGSRNSYPLSGGDKLGIIGSIGINDNVMCNVTYMTVDVSLDDCYTIYYNGGKVDINNKCECFMSYINIAFTPDSNFGLS